jgi:flagellar protein FlaF
VKAAGKLQAARDNFGNSESDFAEALVYNRKLWTVLTTSASHDTNPLPQEIKNNIASLGVFILSHTLQLETKPDPARVTILININRELAAGLRAREQLAAQPMAQSLVENDVPAAMAAINSKA